MISRWSLECGNLQPSLIKEGFDFAVRQNSTSCNQPSGCVEIRNLLRRKRVVRPSQCIKVGCADMPKYILAGCFFNQDAADRPAVGGKRQLATAIPARICPGFAVIVR